MMDGYVLTELHVDVLIRVFLPELLIFIFVTHEREDHLLAYGLEKMKAPKGQYKTPQNFQEMRSINW